MVLSDQNNSGRVYNIPQQTITTEHLTEVIFGLKVQQNNIVELKRVTLPPTVYPIHVSKSLTKTVIFHRQANKFSGRADERKKAEGRGRRGWEAEARWRKRSVLRRRNISYLQAVIFKQIPFPEHSTSVPPGTSSSSKGDNTTKGSTKGVLRFTIFTIRPRIWS